MNTIRLSIVAVTILAAACFSFAQSAGLKPADGPSAGRSPKCPCSRAAPPAAALAVLQDTGEQRAPAISAGGADFSVEGMFVDCCSCAPPCPCELTKVADGCQGLGVHQISSGKYAGDDLVGVRIAHAKVVGEWINLYVDAKDEKQLAAAEKFGRAAFSKFGPIQEVKAARIEISGADGRYIVAVDGGKIMRFETEPVLGGDGKNPIGYTNIKNAVNPTVYQGTCVSSSFSDGDRKVTVEKGMNSHFNPRLKSNGKF
jgi:hypothetical protein